MLIQTIDELRREARANRGMLIEKSIPPDLTIGAMLTSNGFVARLTLSRADGRLPSMTDWKVIATIWGFPDLSPVATLGKMDISWVATWMRDKPPKNPYQDLPDWVGKLSKRADQCLSAARYYAERLHDPQEAKRLRDIGYQIYKEIDLYPELLGSKP